MLLQWFSMFLQWFSMFLQCLYIVFNAFTMVFNAFTMVFNAFTMLLQWFSMLLQWFSMLLHGFSMLWGGTVLGTGTWIHDKTHNCLLDGSVSCGVHARFMRGTQKLPCAKKPWTHGDRDYLFYKHYDIHWFQSLSMIFIDVARYPWISKMSLMAVDPPTSCEHRACEP